MYKESSEYCYNCPDKTECMDYMGWIPNEVEFWRFATFQDEQNNDVTV